MKMLGVKSSWVCAAVRCTFTACEVSDRYRRRRRAAISGKIDLDRHQMLCDRRTHGLSAVGFRDLPCV